MANKIQSDKMQWELSIKDSEAQRNIANLAKANKDLEKSNKEIRLEMARLEAQGKQNSEEWKSLNGVLKNNNIEIGNNSKLIQENEKQLGLQNMTMNQLKKRYQEIQKEMNNTSKAADPKAWESLKNQLDETKGAMASLSGGTQKAEGVMISWGSAMKVGLMGIVADLGQKVLSFIGDLFSLEKIINSTQSTGDKFKWTMEGLDNAFSYFRLTLATMDFSNFADNLKEAYRVAVEVAAQLDEIFERLNSFKIQDIKVQAEIENLFEMSNDVNKSSQERLIALQKIKELTMSQANLQTDIYAQEADAHQKMIKNRTKLNDQQLEFYIDEFNNNRDVIQQARVLISLQNEVNRLKQVGRSQSPAGDARALQSNKEYEIAKKNLEVFEASNAAQIEGIKQVAQIARSYDRANDEFVQKYVESRVKMMSVNVEAARSLRRVDKQINTLTKGIADEALQQRKEIASKSKQEQERMYREEVEAADKANKEKLLSIREMYIAGHISQKEYNAQIEMLEYDLINTKIAINLKFSKGIEDLQNQMLLKQIEKIDKFKAALDKLKKEADDAVNKGIAEETKKQTSELDASINDALAFMQKAAETASGVIDGQKTQIESLQDKYDLDLLALKDSLEMKMLTEQQYNQAVEKLNEETWQARFNINSKGAKKVLDIVMEGLNIASQVSSQLQQIEFTKLETQKNRELSLYGDSYEKRAEIEQKYEQKKIEVQQKYADIDMGIKIAQALASGAQGAMTAVGQLGALAGPAVAAIAAMTALQVGMIVAQRNAIKSNTIGANSGSFGGGERMVLGSPQQSSQVQMPVAQKPILANDMRAINSMHAENKSKDVAALEGLKPLVGTLNKVTGLLENLRDNPISANVVLSDFDAKTKQRDRIKNEGSL